MKRLIGCALIILCIVSGEVLAEGFKPYPRAKIDEAATTAGSKVQIGTQVKVYVTNDGFDKVSAFYKGRYKEYMMPAKPPKLDSGQSVQWGFYIMDDGKDLGNSKYWLKIQHPYIGSTKADGRKIIFSDVRDVTVIEVVRKQ